MFLVGKLIFDINLAQDSASPHPLPPHLHLNRFFPKQKQKY